LVSRHLIFIVKTNSKLSAWTQTLL
jgi:hypothetical protein